MILKISDRREIASGEKLDDMIINSSQNLLKKQFPMMSGFQSTLFQYKQNDFGKGTTAVPLITFRSFIPEVRL